MRGEMSTPAISTHIGAFRLRPYGVLSVNVLTIQREANVTRGASESVFFWLGLVGAAVPPRDPNDDEDQQDEEDDGGEVDGREPAVIREPDEMPRWTLLYPTYRSAILAHRRVC
jgi:hypothetical protein